MKINISIDTLCYGLHGNFKHCYNHAAVKIMSSSIQHLFTTLLPSFNHLFSTIHHFTIYPSFHHLFTIYPSIYSVAGSLQSWILWSCIRAGDWHRRAQWSDNALLSLVDDELGWHRPVHLRPVVATPTPPSPTSYCCRWSSTRCRWQASCYRSLAG